MTPLEDFDFPLNKIVEGALSPFDPYCMGYLNPGASGNGYISTLKLSTGLVNVEGLDPGTEGIVSYDRCEKNDAYIGQINMLTASSFCGINGAVWGYDLAKADKIADGSLEALFKLQGKNKEIPVYPVDPLLDSTERLFGVQPQRRFPPMPGAHVVCANKSTTSKKEDAPCWVWSAIALAIIEDRKTGSNLFIEDTNTCPGDWNKEQVIDFLENTQDEIAKSIILCGMDQGVSYKEIFVGYKYEFVPENYVGCALTCAPYVLLARDAIPPQGVDAMLNMTITQWEDALKLPPLPRSKGK